MENLIVPFNIAKLLKEKGFKETTLAYYWESGQLSNYRIGKLGSYDDCYNNAWKEHSTWKQPMTAAPFYHQVIDWFNQEHRVSLTVKHYQSGSFMFVIMTHNGDATGWTKISPFMGKTYYSYEEALAGGIEWYFKQDQDEEVSS